MVRRTSRVKEFANAGGSKSIFAMRDSAHSWFLSIDVVALLFRQFADEGASIFEHHASADRRV